MGDCPNGNGGCPNEMGRCPSGLCPIGMMQPVMQLKKSEGELNAFF